MKKRGERNASSARNKNTGRRFSLHEADVSNLIRRLGIEPTRKRHFYELIADIQGQLRNFDKHKDDLTPDARSRRRSEVQGLAKALGAVERALAASTPNVRSEVRRILADLL